MLFLSFNGGVQDINEEFKSETGCFGGVGSRGGVFRRLQRAPGEFKSVVHQGWVEQVACEGVRG